MIDIIILSKADNQLLKNLTEQTIKTLLESEVKNTFNIIVIEQVKGVEYSNAKTIFKDDEFHYHKFMNYGISITNNDYVCICNNDLIFEKGWATRLIKTMDENNCLSGSPCYPLWQNKKKFTDWRNSDVHLGYKIQKEISGWCIMIKRTAFEKLNKLDECVSFWSSDSIYAEQLKYHNIKHCIDEKSIVHHYNGGSTTLFSQSKEIQDKISIKEHLKFINALHKKYKIQYVTASHNEKILNNNLNRTNITDRLSVMKNYSNVSKAYNECEKWGDYIVYLHHDVYFDDDWELRLIENINKIEKVDANWGVLGVAGAIYENNQKVIKAHILDRGSLLGCTIENPIEVQTLDELLIVVKRKDNILFDENLENHFYAVDVCLQMNKIGRKNYVIDAFLEHNAFTNDGKLSKDFYDCGDIVCNKYDIRPIATTCTLYKFKNKININMKTRTELINSFIQRYGYKSYLEIGVYNNDLNFNHIVCEYKESCDPNPNANATHKLTSDDFFAQNTKTFDIVFIDGLHHADQCIKDIANSLNCLSDNGTIVMHDCLPTDEFMQQIPLTTQGAWTGNVWQSFVHYRMTDKSLFMFTVNMDYGCGVIKKGSQKLLVSADEINYANFNLHKKEWMNIIDISEINNKLDEYEYLKKANKKNQESGSTLIVENKQIKQADTKIIYSDKDDIPLIIPNYNQLYCLRNLINWFQYYHKGNQVYIIDNNSDYEPLLNFYELCNKGIIENVKVVRYTDNTCVKNIVDFIKGVKNDYYILSNPDISPCFTVPENYLDIWKYCIDKLGYYKVGFNLLLDNIPKHNKNKDIITHWENSLITKVIDIKFNDEIYKAKIMPSDMTYCLYSREKGGWTRDYEKWYNALRLFDAEHIGWYIQPDTKIEENINYFSNCKPASDGNGNNGGNNYNPFRELQPMIVEKYNNDMVVQKKKKRKK
jgi:hypothetical protein